ncbi:MAG: GntR family transcriptional regulator [Muribaculaceae bacterium]|nr:GntR family transcriptional regulator [Muribaculaceae bacterium]
MDFSNIAKPIYLQIADRICDAISDGTYPPDSRIPSVRDYASKFQVNPNTVMRSYEYLADEGVIYNKRGLGFFAAADAEEQIVRLHSETFFKNEVNYFYERLRNLGVSAGQLAQLYDNYLKENPK